MRYQVVRTQSDSITVDARDESDAIDKAQDYSNDYNWKDYPIHYSVGRIEE